MISEQIKDVMDQVQLIIKEDSALTDQQRELMGYAMRSLGLAHSLVDTVNTMRLADLINAKMNGN